ncbi:hypothetical protein [Nocardia donostiensis]|uniref:hypothetical protein n=1 Tax=Nocardia donostiensis TaxID=1538463 RepID=UPI0011155174|nr:hypothetical protein [Nocardia donostiensis]
MLSHLRRVYVWAAAYDRQQGTRYDAELLFVAAAFPRHRPGIGARRAGGVGGAHLGEAVAGPGPGERTVCRNSPKKDGKPA